MNKDYYNLQSINMAMLRGVFSSNIDVGSLALICHLTVDVNLLLILITNRHKCYSDAVSGSSVASGSHGLRAVSPPVSVSLGGSVPHAAACSRHAAHDVTWCFDATISQRYLLWHILCASYLPS